MKRTIRTILCAAVVVLAAASCQKSVEPVQPAEAGRGTIDVSINGLMGEYGVKSSLVNTVRVAWAEGDVVYVFDGTNYLGKLTAALDKKAGGQTDEDRYAKLSGTISAPATTPCTLSLVHSSLMTEPEEGAAVSELSIDMSAQGTATVPFVAYATMEYTGTDISAVVVPFQFATSIIKVNCTGLNAGTAITAVALRNVNTTCKLALSGSEAPVVTGDVNGTIIRTDDEYFAAGKINGEGEAVFQIAVPELTTASEERVLTVAQGADKFIDKNFTMKSLSAATSVNTVCQLIEKTLPAPLPGVFTVADDGQGNVKKVHFSQGNLYYDGFDWGIEEEQYYFRTYNGKGKYNKYGYNKKSGTASTDWGLFGWVGESSTAFTYSPEIYGVSISTTNTDYCSKGDDSLKADWGTTIDNHGTWFTLSNDEFKYLLNTRYGGEKEGKSYQRATINSDATDGGICGLILYPDGYTSQTGAKSYTIAEWETLESAYCVFLPAAGSRKGSTLSEVGQKNLYWTKTSDRRPGKAYVMSLLQFGSISFMSVDSYCGNSVRLVTEVK